MCYDCKYTLPITKTDLEIEESSDEEFEDDEDFNDDYRIRVIVLKRILIYENYTHFLFCNFNVQFFAFCSKVCILNKMLSFKHLIMCKFCSKTKNLASKLEKKL